MKSKIIQNYRLLLDQVSEEFKEKCNQISLEAKRKMELTAESDILKRQQILSTQQNSLKEAVSVLTINLSKLNQKLLKDLEQEDTDLDAQKLKNIDTFINNL